MQTAAQVTWQCLGHYCYTSCHHDVLLLSSSGIEVVQWSVHLICAPQNVGAAPVLRRQASRSWSHHVCGSAANAECNAVLYVRVPKSLKEAMVLDQDNTLRTAVLTAVAFTI